MVYDLPIETHKDWKSMMYALEVANELFKELKETVKELAEGEKER